MSIAYYRKYRPQIFDEVVGQEHVVKILKKAINNNKISHAYLFSGPKGCGKTSIAKILAKTLNCLDAADQNCCGICNNCLEKEQIDIIEIDAASNNGVEEIRDLRNSCNLLPALGKYKIYIIDEVHMLSNAAFNALLKTLEEPPAHIIFILATTEINKIPLTIISRTQRFDFIKISNSEMAEQLKIISKKEHITISDDVIDLIVDYADGSLRDALSLLDQISNLDIITLTEVTKVTGITNNLIVKQINDFLVNNSKNELEKLLQEVVDLNYDVAYIVKKLIIHSEMKIKKLKNDYIGIKKEIEMINKFNYIYNLIKASALPSVIFKMSILELLVDNNLKNSDVEVNNKITKEINKEVIKKELSLTELNDVSVLVNNTLATARKEHLLNYSEKIKDNYDVFLIDKAKTNLKLAIAGENHLIFEVKNKAMLIQLNKNNSKIKKKLTKLFKKNIDIVFVGTDKLKNIKNYYIENKKNIKYIDNTVLANTIKSEFKDIVEMED